MEERIEREGSPDRRDGRRFHRLCLTRIWDFAFCSIGRRRRRIGCLHGGLVIGRIDPLRRSAQLAVRSSCGRRLQRPAPAAAGRPQDEQRHKQGSRKLTKRGVNHAKGLRTGVSYIDEAPRWRKRRASPGAKSRGVWPQALFSSQTGPNPGPLVEQGHIRCARRLPSPRLH